MQKQKSINSLEILYAYVNNVGCFQEQEFKFTTEYDIQYNKEDKSIKITNNDNNNHLNNFFGNDIANINILVGKNGCGKTTLLNILGSKENERLYYLKYNFKDPNSGWFIIYKTNLKNIFVIEVLSPGLLNVTGKTTNNNYNDELEFYTYIYEKKDDLLVFKNELIEKELSKDFIYYAIRKEIPNKNNKNEEIIKLRLFNRKYINKDEAMNQFNYSNLYYLISHKLSFTKDINNVDLFLNIMTHNYKKNDSTSSETLISRKEIIKFKNYINSLTSYKAKAITIMKIFIFKTLCLIIKKKQYDTSKEIKDILNSELYPDNLDKNITIISNAYQKNVPAKDIKFKNLIYNFLNSMNLLPDSQFDYNDINYEHPFKILINLNESYNKDIFKFLKSYEEMISYDIDINSHFNNFLGIITNKRISEGELEYFEFFGKLSYTILNAKQKSCIILLDEPDNFFHPDRITKFIFHLTKLIEELKAKQSLKAKYQIIITTHSPFMLSDIPKEFITKIDIVDNKDGTHFRRITKAENSFASNYYDIIKDSFFLKNTIGEFANKKIKEILNMIHSIERDLSNNSSNTYKIDYSHFNNIKRLIDVIDEPFIRNALKEELNRVYRKMSKKNEIDIEIEILEKKLKELKELKESGDNR